MAVLARLYAWSAHIATFGGFGAIAGAGVISSLLALPLLLIMHSIAYVVGHYLLLWVVIICLCMVIIQGALMAGVGRREMVLGTVLGAALAFDGGLLRGAGWKVLLFGFVLFHGVRMLVPIFVLNQLAATIRALPGPLGVVVDNLIYGAVVHLIIRAVVFVG